MINHALLCSNVFLGKNFNMKAIFVVLLFFISLNSFAGDLIKIEGQYKRVNKCLVQIKQASKSPMFISSKYFPVKTKKWKTFVFKTTNRKMLESIILGGRELARAKSGTDLGGTPVGRSGTDLGGTPVGSPCLGQSIGSNFNFKSGIFVFSK